MKEYHVNAVALVTIPVALWLGFSGRVDWWVILLVALSTMEAKFTWQR